MCGLVAYQGSELNVGVLREASRCLAHRGPDDEGLHVDENAGVGLGHRRLSILDPAHGQQPMSRFGATLIHNGEIYNYRELRDDLESLGYAFRTTSDTEVILAAYDEWGEECVERFRGMFAFVLWDARRARLFLARDRLGQKPLYYAQTDGGFLAGSEVSALLSFPGLARGVDRESLPLYLTLGYVPPPRTGFGDLRKLPPAHTMVVKEGAVRDRTRYWEPTARPDRSGSFGRVVENLRETVHESVRLRMRSDVPVGAFLSGGIDSSIVVALMVGMSDRPVRTFSVGFGDEKYDEIEYANELAEAAGTDHTVHRLSLRPGQVRDLFPRLVDHYGEPYADPSAIPTYLVAREASREVKVVLTGDGADEAFGGYGRYRKIDRYQRADRWIPGLLKRGFRRSLGSMPTSSKRDRFSDMVHFYTRLMASPPSDRHFMRMAHFMPAQVEALVPGTDPKDAAAPVGLFNRLFERVNGSRRHSETAMLVDTFTWLGSILTKVDIATMMNSLEARSPFLDHRVVELGASIPYGYKVRNGAGKHVLREAFRDELPERILNRRKSGFSVPRKRWFREGLAEYLRDLLLSPEGGFYDLFDRPSVETLLGSHQSGDEDYSPELWVLLMLKLWWSRFDVHR